MEQGITITKGDDEHSGTYPKGENKLVGWLWPLSIAERGIMECCRRWVLINLSLLISITSCQSHIDIE